MFIQIWQFLGFETKKELILTGARAYFSAI